MKGEWPAGRAALADRFWLTQVKGAQTEKQREGKGDEGEKERVKKG